MEREDRRRREGKESKRKGEIEEKKKFEFQIFKATSQRRASV